MISAINEITARLKPILSGELFFDPSGGMSVPEIVIGDIQAKRRQQNNVQDFPFVIIRPLGFGDNDRSNTMSLILVSGVGVDDDADIIEGLTSLDRLVKLVLRVTEPRDLGKWSIQNNNRTEYGDKGAHRHPYYEAATFLTLVKNKNCMG